jgi:hypothetical protein
VAEEFELIPDVGVRLPRGAGLLRFGLSEEEAQWLVSTLGDVRDGGWVCGRHWTFSARYGDLFIWAAANAASAKLSEIQIERGDDATAWAGQTPVTWRDIDLFGYPATEVKRAVEGELGTRFLDRQALVGDFGLTLGFFGPASAPGSYLSRISLTGRPVPDPAPAGPPWDR